MRLSLFIALALAVPAAAQTTLIDFETLPGPDGTLGTPDDIPLVAPGDFGSQTTQLTTEFQGVGVIFEPDMPPTDNINEVLNATAVTQAALFSPPNALVSLGFGKIAWRFTVPVTQVTATIGLGNGTDAMTAFDAQGTVIATILGNAENVTITSMVDIARVEVVSAVIATPTIDNLFFNGATSSPIGTPYCTAADNTSGVAAQLRANGQLDVTANDLVLLATSVPQQQFGIFLASLAPDFVMGTGGASDGNLCLGAGIGRFNLPNQIQATGLAGQFQLQVDLNSIPQPNMFRAVVSGDTWYFQAWFRDTSPLGSNFSEGLEIAFI